MDGDYSGWRIGAVFCALLLEAALYGFGSAIQNVDEEALEEEAEKGSRKEKDLLSIVNRPGRFVHTIQTYTAILYVATGAYIFGGLIFGSLPSWKVLLRGAAAIILFVSLGTVIPKRWAAEHPEGWSRALLPVVKAVETVLFPFTSAAMGISWVFLKVLGIDKPADQDNVTEKEIMSMVNEGHEQGVLEASEAEMITNIFQLDDKKAEEIMTHRTNVVALDGKMTLGQAAHFILEEGNNSRFPVYREDIDDIIGILHMRDAMVYREKQVYEETAIEDIEGLLRLAHFIPESRNVSDLFQEMQAEKIHMEIVVDEYGQTSGIITMEDILEEIVGNILDEYDEEEEYIRENGDGTFIIKGMAPLDQVEAALKTTLSEEGEEEYDTVNGFLISLLGRIPGEDERPCAEYGGYSFRILKMENKMVSLVKAVKTEK